MYSCASFRKQPNKTLFLSGPGLLSELVSLSWSFQRNQFHVNHATSHHELCSLSCVAVFNHLQVSTQRFNVFIMRGGSPRISFTSTTFQKSSDDHISFAFRCVKKYSWNGHAKAKLQQSCAEICGFTVSQRNDSTQLQNWCQTAARTFYEESGRISYHLILFQYNDYIKRVSEESDIYI